MKKQKLTFSNTYHYYNCNPHHKLTDDCVIRAICSSTGDSWEDTMRALAEWSIKTGYMLNTPECYGKYLESIGYVKQKQPSQKDGKKVRFKDFCKKFDGHAICHCGVHIKRCKYRNIREQFAEFFQQWSFCFAKILYSH